MAKFFMPSPAQQPGQLFAKALLQTAGFWGFFLVAVPGAIVWFENIIGIQRFDLGAGKWLLVAAFLASGSTCIYCAWLFAKHGSGTPVPFAAPRKLVIRGPYRYVRNPMAIGGIFQGVLVGLYLGSSLTAIYALSGAVFWHIIARPPEERDLVSRHGADYEAYRSSVRCWLPNLKPYADDPTKGA